MIRLLKPAKGKVVSYMGEVLERDNNHLFLVAVWTWPLEDLGYVVFEPHDRFYEHFYSDRWYNVFAIHRADGALKGWYCNITRPAIFSEDVVESEDLELDLFISPDRQHVLVLDEDEFAARDLLTSDPAAHAAALAALQELQERARRGDAPFDESVASYLATSASSSI